MGGLPLRRLSVIVLVRLRFGGSVAGPSLLRVVVCHMGHIQRRRAVLTPVLQRGSGVGAPR